MITAPKASDSRIKVGDVVCGPSTDYRDIRKAAYQEYLVTNDYNVARIAATTSVKAGASIGVAFSAAAISLGVCFGLDFAGLSPRGPDLWGLVRHIGADQLPEDVRTECLSSIDADDRPGKGEWLAIWGGTWHEFGQLGRC